MSIGSGYAPLCGPTGKPVGGTDHCQCTVCKQWFNSTHAFDGHRRGKTGVNRRCLSVAEMQQKGYIRNADGYLVSSSFERPPGALQSPTAPTRYPRGSPSNERLPQRF
jgi:hypothetical protein